MSNNNQHKAGYKHTPLGWIPEEWEVSALEMISKFSQGVQVDLEKQLLEHKNGCVKFLRIENYTQDSKDFRFITEMDARGKKINADDIVIVRYGASAGFIGKGLEGVLANNLFKVEPIADILTKNFLFITLKSDRAYKFFQTSMFGGAMPALSFDIVGNYIVPIPTLLEQGKIAAILSTWDEAITKIQELMGQLQHRNKGLMQQLLTGKKRLKGFDDEWKRLHIYELASEVSLKNKEDKQLTVLSCTKYAGLVPSLEYFGRQVFGSDTSTYKVVPKAHFAYATNHIEEGSIGYQSTFEEALISPMYTVFKTSEEVNDDFLYKVLKSHQYIHQYRKRMEGSIDRRGGLHWDEFSKIPVHLPVYSEQTAIALIINKAVEEVKLQEQCLAALQQQKKGLMQKLITGEVRVKIN